MSAAAPGWGDKTVGVLSDLADNAVTFAGGSVLGDSVTAESKINYLRPATDAERLLAKATVVGSGKTQAVCRCDVFMLRGQEGTLCAAAQGAIRKARLGLEAREAWIADQVHYCPEMDSHWSCKLLIGLRNSKVWF